jgi:general secretion pathway protein L
MSAIQTIIDSVWRWLDQAAQAAITVVARFAAPRAVRLVEGEPGQFAITGSGGSKPTGVNVEPLRIENGKVVSSQPANVETALRGSRLELVLRTDRFVFKPLELPSRAAEFLDGVVRAQIDRLTPWNAEQAAFGFSKPADAGPGRIVVTVAATSKAMLAQYIQAFTARGVQSISMTTPLPDAAANAPPIKILEENIAGILNVDRARRILMTILIAGCLIAVGTTIAATVWSNDLQARQDVVARRIAQSRAAAIAARNQPGDPTMVAEAALARRKNQNPSSVIVLDDLSQILPDNTYVTELRIEGEKLRLIGTTLDAPSLIRLMEQSQQFSHATFFAPTTRAPSDTGDRFNIEARIEPNFKSKP